MLIESCYDCTARLVAREGDTQAAVLSKAIWLYFAVAGVISGALLLFTHDRFMHFIGLYTVPSTLALAGILMVKKKLTRWMEATFCLQAMLVITAFDLAIFPTGPRGWSWFVVLLDALIVARSPERLRTLIAAWVVLWLIVTGLERGLRYGLLDWDVLIPYEERVPSCSRPPCAGGAASAMSSVMQPMMVFVIDFYTTVSFAKAVDEEKRKIAAAGVVSRNLAESLAMFNLEEAERCLAAEGESLPAELAQSFSRLLANLRSYRPYLPGSLMVVGGGDGSQTDDHDAECSTTTHEVTEPTTSPPPSAVSQADDLDSSIRSSSSAMISNESHLGHRKMSGSNLSFATAAPPSANPRPTSAAGQRRPTSAAGQRRPTSAAGQRRAHDHRWLTVKRASLLVVSLRSLSAIAVQYAEQYINVHADYLAEVLHNVRKHRGGVNSFVGDVVQASFNAFKPAPMHGASALSAALQIRTAPFYNGHRARCAVVTGSVCAGSIGTDSMLSLSMFGQLVGDAACVAEAGKMLDEGVLCTRATFQSVSMSFSLRVLLHRLVVPSEHGAERELTVYKFHQAHLTSQCKLLEIEPTTPSTPPANADEWMYAMEKEPGKMWEAYNDAGFLYLTQGEAAARRKLHAAKAPVQVLRVFDEELSSRCGIAFVPRRSAAAEHECDTSSCAPRRGPTDPRSSAW